MLGLIGKEEKEGEDEPVSAEEVITTGKSVNTVPRLE